MGSIGYDDILARTALFREIGANEHQAGKLSLGASRRLQAHMLHTADLGEHPFKPVEQGQGSLKQLWTSHRVNLRETGQARHHFVDLGIVLHRAGAERVELALDREISLREAREMTQDFQFSQFGKTGDLIAQKRQWNHNLGLPVLLRPIASAPTFRSAFEKQLRLSDARGLISRR